MKSILRTCTALTMVAAFTGSVMAQDLPTSIGPGEGKVSIVAWVAYIERGESDPGIDWVTQFEKDTGCMVEVKTAATSDEMVTLMNGGGFDLVTASGDASLRLIAGGTVVPINTDLIPSWNTLDERLKDGAWFTVDGKHYGTPYQWGPNVLMYNTNVFPVAPESWNVVFEPMDLPDGKPNAGRVQAYDGAIYVADAANYLMNKDPSLGIKDPYELNETQFAAVVALLKQQRALVPKYWHDAAVQIEDFNTEGLVASSSWPYQVGALSFQDPPAPVGSTIPKEGATGWADTTMLAAKAEHPNCAYMWMEHSLQPKVQGDVAYWFGSVPVVPAACKGNELLTDEGCAYNGFDNFDQIKFWRTPTAQCTTQSECVPYSKWVEAFNEVKGS